MAKLIYVTNVSLDSYIEDERGTFYLFLGDDDLFRVLHRRPAISGYVPLRAAPVLKMTF